MSVQSRIMTPLADATGSGAEGVRAGEKIMILGLGNSLLGDDGAGVHVIRRLQAVPSFPPGVLLIDGGTLSFSLLELVESSRVLIVVDAMEFGAHPGAVRWFIDHEVDQFLSAPTRRSVHDANLGDLMRMCALRGVLPERRMLIGIQPQVIEWNESPSEPVSAGIDVVCDRIGNWVEEWI